MGLGFSFLEMSVFRKLEDALLERPLIPFSIGGFFGLCAALYMARKIDEHYKKMENGS